VVVAVDHRSGRNRCGGGGVDIGADNAVNFFTNPSYASEHGLDGDKGTQRGVFGGSTSPSLVDRTKVLRVIFSLTVAFS
jgi:hypothetical protein